MREDEERVRKAPSHEVGQALDALSVDDLAERIDLLRREIARLEAARAAAGAVLDLEPSGPWPPYHFCPALGGPGP